MVSFSWVINMQDLKKTGIKPVVIDEIKALAQIYEIQKVILFGSKVPEPPPRCFSFAIYS